MGFVRVRKPPSHIFAGEKVCIQAMMPAQSGFELDSAHNAVMASGVVITAFGRIVSGMAWDALRPATISCECRATVSRVRSPYRCWLPVTNQSSFFRRSIILLDPAHVSAFRRARYRFIIDNDQFS